MSSTEMEDAACRILDKIHIAIEGEYLGAVLCALGWAFSEANAYAGCDSDEALKIMASALSGVKNAMKEGESPWTSLQ